MGFQVTAHYKVGKAIKKGELLPSKICSDCGSGNKKIVAHHEDYTKPLDVIWLCSSCHGKRKRTIDCVDGEYEYPLHIDKEFFRAARAKALYQDIPIKVIIEKLLRLWFEGKVKI